MSIASRSALGGLLALLALSFLSQNVHAGSIKQAQKDQLKELLHQDCGSCHGLKLTGGLGPALTRSALQGKTLQWVSAVIRDGRPGTPMPSWKTLLSSAEIDWLAHYLKNPGVAP